MVVMIIAILGATALPQFLDFRKEAKSAVVREHLRTLRSGIKNQLLQIKLKCNNLGTSQTLSSYGVPANLQHQFYQNNITYFGTSSLWRICTEAEIPNPADRLFWNLPQSQYTYYYENSNTEPLSPSPIPQNPFAADIGKTILGRTVYGQVSAFHPISSSDLQAYGGACGFADSNAPFYYVHWILNEETGEIFAGTNTEGINECAF